VKRIFIDIARSKHYTVIWTNIDILELTQLPEHLMIGRSYIGLEFGQMFRRFGSKVTIIAEID
jgi:pyruvate/2-oxoglutarate dehydrogenase complex dihydrolipoamide dehydrogenase (E3) component